MSEVLDLVKNVNLRKLNFSNDTSWNNVCRGGAVKWLSLVSFHWIKSEQVIKVCSIDILSLHPMQTGASTSFNKKA